MLYNTPFPVTPQTDRAEKTERNAEIMARYKSGETGARLAQTFGISEQRINQIVRGRRK
jgi:Mor family transcriptional regulator